MGIQARQDMRNDSQPCADSDRERVESICEQLGLYTRRLLSVWRQKVDENEVQELVQEAVLRILEKKSRDWLMTAPLDEVLPYGKTIIKNRNVDLNRSCKVLTNADTSITLAEESQLTECRQGPDYDPTQESYLMAAIKEAIPDDRRREIFVSQHLCGEWEKAIAGRLGVERTRVWRAKQGEGKSDSDVKARIRHILERNGRDYASFFF
jgi:DNA-directed RNA polymerase specialized sigma24 family protein